MRRMPLVLVGLAIATASLAGGARTNAQSPAPVPQPRQYQGYTILECPPGYRVGLFAGVQKCESLATYSVPSFTPPSTPHLRRNNNAAALGAVQAGLGFLGLLADLTRDTGDERRREILRRQREWAEQRDVEYGRYLDQNHLQRARVELQQDGERLRLAQERHDVDAQDRIAKQMLQRVALMEQVKNDLVTRYAWMLAVGTSVPYEQPRSPAFAPGVANPFVYKPGAPAPKTPQVRAQGAAAIAASFLMLLEAEEAGLAPPGTASLGLRRMTGSLDERNSTGAPSPRRLARCGGQVLDLDDLAERAAYENCAAPRRGEVVDLTDKAGNTKRENRLRELGFTTAIPAGQGISLRYDDRGVATDTDEFVRSTLREYFSPAREK